MKIALSSDHAGYEESQEIKKFLGELGHEVIDFGPKEYNASDDYPDFMFPAAKSVATKECEAGIIIGGSGQGEAMSANRIKGVRCAVFYGPVVPTGKVDIEGDLSTNPYEILKLSRMHNLANVLSLSSRFLNLGQMKRAIDIWLSTPIGSEERHVRRAGKLDSYD
jgi:ribose 5-phosphate isomerase B